MDGLLNDDQWNIRWWSMEYEWPLIDDKNDGVNIP